MVKNNVMRKWNALIPAILAGAGFLAGTTDFHGFDSAAKRMATTIQARQYTYSEEQLAAMMAIPAALEGYRTNQFGPLSRIDSSGNVTTDSTFTVTKMKIPCNGVMITGWLYLPPGDAKCPLVVLTNGGGNNVRAIKSFSDFMAPILAHCGYAAFVHDKRGTGESEGDYVKTTYDDYINDAGSCANYLAGHRRINPDKIGVMGASEGGRVAVVAASRFPVFSFVISQSGTMVGAIDDRMNAQINGMIDQGIITDSIADLVRPVWRRSFEAWASRDPEEHSRIDMEIEEMRKVYPRGYLPFKKSEMDSIPDFAVILPTWNSLGNDYMTEMKHFRKKWLAIYGAEDRVVPTEESVRNIGHYMSRSGNKSYNIAIIPRMGHVPVDSETKIRVKFDYLIINWLDQNVR